jgi:hypothetical protein
LLNERILVRVAVDSPGNFAQGVATLNSVAGHSPACSGIRSQQVGQGLLKAFALGAGAGGSGLVDSVIQINGNVLLNHAPPPKKIEIGNWRLVIELISNLWHYFDLVACCCS